jgi:DNA-directed RNA polymerase subunit RPC12/RpoP
MRYFCFRCNKCVTNDLPEDSYIRAALICPECIGHKKELIDKLLDLDEYGPKDENQKS